MRGAINCTDTELCTFLQDLAEGYSPISYLDMCQYVPWKSTPIASKSYQKGKTTGSFPGSQSLMMLPNSTDPHGSCISPKLWPPEPKLGRVAYGVAHRVDRLRAIGNGQVPRVAATAWRILTDDI